MQVTDVKTASVNDLLTPNRNLRIAGSKIKIVGTDVSVGVYFVNQDTAEKTKVDPSEIVNNNPSELIIVIPDLISGTYKLEVTSQYGPSTQLKEPRTTVFDRMLTVL
jgi:vacuolar-type H+-ATPase subunit F/Vma7